MSYTPINATAFTAAYSGAISGMAVSGWITNPSPGSYVLLTQIAGAFAQAFDQAWNNSATLNELELLSITAVCQNEFIGRGPGPLNNLTFQQVSNWTVPAAACAALVLQGDAYFASQGIIPPVAGSGIPFGPWVPIAASATPTLPNVTTALLVNAGVPPAAQVDLTMPPAPANGQVLLINDYLALSGANPILLTPNPAAGSAAIPDFTTAGTFVNTPQSISFPSGGSVGLMFFPRDNRWVRWL